MKKRRPVPEGFAQDNMVMTVLELREKYQAASGTVQRWRDECGTEPKRRRRRSQNMKLKQDLMRSDPECTVMCLNCEKPDCTGWCEKVGYIQN